MVETPAQTRSPAQKVANKEMSCKKLKLKMKEKKMSCTETCKLRYVMQHQEPAHVYFVHEVRTRVKSEGDRN